jgi:hypothetical protein
MATANPLSSRLDRGFYAFMAFLFVVAATVGFAPNSIAILTGTKTIPPLIIHAHALAMASWLVLLATQASLVAANKRHIHRRLGMVSVILAPIIVILMISLAFPLPGEGEHAQGIAVIQIKRITLFSLFFIWAFVARKTDSESHKRLMFLATLVVIDAAVNRMRWFLPGFGFDNNMALTHAYELLLLVPILVYDIKKLGRVHRVNLIGTTLIVAFSIVGSALW